MMMGERGAGDDEINKWETEWEITLNYNKTKKQKKN